MHPWLAKWSNSARAADGMAGGMAGPALRAARVLTERSVLNCERLEERQLMSVSTDVTNTYVGTMTTHAGELKVKEAVTVALTSQSDQGFVLGQISSTYGGKVDVRGFLHGKTLQMVGTTSGRDITLTVGKKGKSLKGEMVNGVDDSVSTFKLRVASDAPARILPAGRTAGNSSLTTFAASGTTAAPRVIDASDPALDPSIDPATGLPIDPVTGKTVDPDTTVAADGSTEGSGSLTSQALAAAATSFGPGSQIGNNYSFLGTYDGTFNGDGTGSIFDIQTGSTSGQAVNGTRPGTDPRSVTFTTSTQDTTGLITGTLDIEGFGTFSYSGFVNGTHIDLVLSGPGPGQVSLDFSNTFDSVSGQIITAQANGFQAQGPINASFTSGGTGGGGGGSGQQLPSGEELYHVDPTDSNGAATQGNLDPNGQSLGEDFVVGSASITINSLGAFDDEADGLNNTITVAIYNVSSPGTPIVTANITTANSELAPNSSFRYLTTFTPVTLARGVYRIVAYGYGGAELAGDVGSSTYTGPSPTFNTGQFFGTISFPGSNSLGSNNYFSNTGGTQIVYPTLPADLPLNRYLAGSFLFDEVFPPDPDDGGGPPLPPPPPPVTQTRPGGSAYPGGVANTVNGPEVFGGQSGFIIP